jgi:hypothetical protein
MSIKSIYIRCDETTLQLAKKLADNNSRSMNKQLVHMINCKAREEGIILDEPKLELVEEKVKVHPHGLESWDANGSPVAEEDDETTIGLKGLAGISKLDSDHTSSD